MADGNFPPKQDFAPPWLKFPTTDSPATPKSANPKTSGYQSDRNRQRREDPYHTRAEYNRLHRQTSFDFHDAKRFPPSQGKYRHHSVDDDYYGYPCGYGYYPPNYNYEKYGMHYSSQPSLARNGGRDGKYNPGRFPPMNGVDFSPHYDLYEPYHHQSPHKRGYSDRDYPRDGRDVDGRSRNRGADRDRPFSDDFPSLVGSGESTPEVKQTKPGSGVWENPPKSNRNEESSDLIKNSSPGIYKALVPNKNGQSKKTARDGTWVNGSAKDSPAGKGNKEGMRQSPTPDLAIVTQPKKLGDKKSEFLRALRNESSVRNGENHPDLNENAVSKKPVKDNESQVNGDITAVEMNGEQDKSHGQVNGTIKETMEYNLDKPINGESKVNGEALIPEVDHMNLSGEDEEKRLLLSMGWVEEDNTEYVITEDEIREFQHLLQNRYDGKKNGLKPTLRNSLKLENPIASSLLNSTHMEKQEHQTNKPL